jgi:Zn-dependent M28 family amino/carboxypeptidase
MIKNKFLLLLLHAPFFVIAQNSLPVVSINSANVDTATKTININYNVLDSDNDLLEVKVFLSADSGISYVAPIQQATGALGYPVTPGNNKTIVINYNTDSLYNAANGDVNAWFMIKIVANDRKVISIQNMLPNIDSTLVYQYMQYIAQPRHHTAAPIGLETIKDSIEANFTRHHLQTQRSAFNFGAVASENILGRKPGLWQEKNTIIVDAHFDAVANVPGADDNGSSLAAVLIASKILSDYNFEKTIQFIGFDKEESGLKGSLYYVNNSIPDYQQTEAVLNMEMIGYYSDAPNSQQVPTGFAQLFPAAVDSITNGGNQGVWLFTVGNANSASLSLAFDTIARNYVPEVKSLVMNVPANGQIAPDLRRSDHAPFWDAGFKALMLTDGAEYRNSNYHTPGDSLGTLNIPYLVRNIKAVTAVAAELAKPISAHHEHKGAWQLLKDIPFSIEKKQANFDLVLFPNPSNHHLYYKFNQSYNAMNLCIKDLTGKIILQNELNSVVAAQVYHMPINSLNAGVYYVSVNCNNETFIKKLVVTEGHHD